MSDGWYTGNSQKITFDEKVKNSENSENSEILNSKKKKINSRAKGQRGEREVAVMFIAVMQEVEAAVLAQFPPELVDKTKFKSEEVKRNTMQSDRGGYDLHGIPLLAPEVKFTETFLFNDWWSQCTKQAKHKEFPVLIYRCKRMPWRVRSYSSVQFPGMQTMQWVIADYTFGDFLHWYQGLYFEFITGQAGEGF